MQLMEMLERSILVRRLQALAICCGTQAPRSTEEAMEMADRLKVHGFRDILYITEMLYEFCAWERQRIDVLQDLLAMMTGEEQAGGKTVREPAEDDVCDDNREGGC